MHHPSLDAASAAARPIEPHPGDIGLERLIFFSDAVFAIAITLLALEIRLPAGANPHDNAGLLAALLALWPKYLSYTISFLVIGLYWMGHHRMFRHIVRYDRRLLFLNLLLLLIIGFVPFPTALLGEYTYAAATICYALTMLVVGLLSAALWWYATGAGGRLLAQPLSAAQLWRSRGRTLVAPAVFLLSIGLAGVGSDLARLTWLLIAPLLLLQSAT